MGKGNLGENDRGCSQEKGSVYLEEVGSLVERGLNEEM